MRTIKFRAWDIYKKVFIPEEAWAVLPGGERETAVMVRDWEDYKEGEHFYPEYQVLMQFTGLTDKNGKEIYEGDILDYGEYTGMATGRCLYTVEWDIPHAEFRTREIRQGLGHGGYSSMDTAGEVIGNLYENPKLLSQEKPNETV